MKCGVFSELSVLWEEGQTAYRLGWGTGHYSKNEWRRKEKVVFKVQQEENPLYGLIGMGMAALS